MLTELKISNFRIFDYEVTVRFRPITVLIGRNSSGKSSVVKFLLMLQQSSEPGKSQFLTPDGGRVRLGAFPGLKNSLTKKRNLTFQARVTDTTDRPSPILARYLKSAVNFKSEDLIYIAGGTASYSKRTSSSRSYFSILDKSTNEASMRFTNDGLEGLPFWEISQPRELRESLSRMQRGETIRRTSRETKRHFEMVDEFFARNELISTVRYQFDAIRHLSPVRADLERVILASSPAYDNVGQGGEFALPHLQAIIDNDRDRYEFIRPYLERVIDIERVNFKTSSQFVSQAMAKNMTTGAEVVIADFGFGVSQCLPIFVQGAIMAPHTTLVVEQPEAQLHPTAQLELGSYFADLWKQRNVASIIETHSDNILLRLRRLIAKGELDHEDVSVAYFTIDEERGNMPIIKNLDINEDGSMESGLPMEFFGADVIEGLKLGARA